MPSTPRSMCACRKQLLDGRVVVQLWINTQGHADILKSGATLQELADDAFALLLAKQRGKSR
jgi:hypothetical protein